MFDSFLTQILKIIIALDVIAALVYVVLIALVLPAKKKRYADGIGISGIVPLTTPHLVTVPQAGAWMRSDSPPTESLSSISNSPQKERTPEEDLDRLNRSLDDLMNTGL